MEMSDAFYKAIITGLVFILLGVIMSHIFKNLKPELPKECEEWNKNYVMEVSLFFTGFVFRYLLEIKTISSFII